MGGDAAPGEVVAGAVAAARDRRITIRLVGPTAIVAAELARVAGASVPANISILDAAEVIGMDEAPLAALRRKPRASIKVAAETVVRGDADALYSAGHTGATLMAAHAAFGMLPGAERPALAILIPTLTGQSVLLDTGATMDCRPEHLRSFGVMGAAFARIALQVDGPRVGLLSVGEEPAKGNDLVREAHGLLLTSRGITFVGNIEARDLFAGHADVVVCDGFTGNVVLKTGEGLVATLETMLRREVGQSMASRIANWLVGRGFKRLKVRMDAGERGGAPLLGVNGVAVIGHGRSDARAIRNGIAATARLVEGRMVARLTEALGNGATGVLK
jgi:glycerol-3-phosphate acyltransferase PlsX